MATTYSQNKIVTDGLVLYLDAANYKSHTSGSTSLFNIVDPSVSASLINGISVIGDQLILDGVNQYIQLSQTYTFTDAFTIKVYHKPISTSTRVMFGNNGIDYIQINNAAAIGVFSSV